MKIRYKSWFDKLGWWNILIVLCFIACFMGIIPKSIGTVFYAIVFALGMQNIFIRLYEWVINDLIRHKIIQISYYRSVKEEDDKSYEF